MIIKRRTITLGFAVILCLTVSAQEKNTIEKAMKDELDRSMSELRNDQYGAPFFIRYRINDLQSIQASASLGALHRSDSVEVRTKDIRVMVGDYEFNDESLNPSDMTGETSASIGYNDYTIPLGDDYYGIRRSLWITTDAIYKMAGSIYKSHVTRLEKDGKSLDEVDHNRFAKVPIVTYTEPLAKQRFTKRELEDYARKASAFFTKYDNLLASVVDASSSVNTEYFINSEGSSYRTSRLTSQIKFTVTTMEDGNLNYETHVHKIEQEDTLPSIEETEKMIKSLMGRLERKDKSSLFKDNYYGPVLFVGETVSSLFESLLLDQLVASTNLSYEGDYYGGYNDNSYSLDERIDERVIDKKLSVTLLPTLTEWNGEPVENGFQIDSEGVKPSDTLVLIDKGILKNLRTTRTLSDKNLKANGTGDHPGVVHIASSETSHNSEVLKQQLIGLAKEYDQKNAVIVKGGSPYGGLYDLTILKVNVETGEEELFTGANISSLGINNLKRIIGISSNLTLSNKGAVSYIAPDALLLEQIEVRGGYNQSINVKDPLVENPLSLEE